MSSLCKAEYRALLAAVVKAEPEAKRMLKILLRLGAQNMRCDYMYARMPDGSYQRCIDLSIWYADCRNGIFVALVRHGDNDWNLHS